MGVWCTGVYVGVASGVGTVQHVIVAHFRWLVYQCPSEQNYYCICLENSSGAQVQL